MKHAKSTLLFPSQAAQLCGCAPETLRKVLRTGALPSVRLGNARRIPVADLEAFLQERYAGHRKVRVTVEPLGLLFEDEREPVEAGA